MAAASAISASSFSAVTCVRAADHGGASLRVGGGQCFFLSQRQQCRLRRQHSNGTALRRASPSMLQSGVASQAEFAEEETVKFRSGILRILEEEPSVSTDKEKLADVCAKVFQELAEEYNGTFPVEPFAKMKAACDEVGLAGGATAVRAAIGWSRGYLYHDWNQWKSKA